MELSGRVALVTGGSRGIGRAIAIALAEAGVDIAVNFKSKQIGCSRGGLDHHQIRSPCDRDPSRRLAS